MLSRVVVLVFFALICYVRFSVAHARRLIIGIIFDEI